jgi:hypothetical protein
MSECLVCLHSPLSVLAGLMSILRTGLVSIERISISLELFGGSEDVSEAEVRTGEWLRTLVKKKAEKIGRVWCVKLIWEAEKSGALKWKN